MHSQHTPSMHSSSPLFKSALLRTSQSIYTVETHGRLYQMCGALFLLVRTSASYKWNRQKQSRWCEKLNVSARQMSSWFYDVCMGPENAKTPEIIVQKFLYKKSREGRGRVTMSVSISDTPACIVYHYQQIHSRPRAFTLPLVSVRLGSDTMFRVIQVPKLAGT